MSVGRDYDISRFLTDIDRNTETVTFILQIKDESGIITELSWKNIKIQGQGFIRLDLPWSPEKSGSYFIETFVWDNLETPKPLESFTTFEVNAEPEPEPEPKPEIDTKSKIKWQKAYGGPNGDIAYSVMPTDDGGYIVAGSTTSFGAGDLDVYVIKLNRLGDVTWSSSFGGSDFDVANIVIQTFDGGYLTAGRTRSFGAGSSDFYVLKLNPDGTLDWNRTYGQRGYDNAFDIEPLNDGYIISGYTHSRLGPGDVNNVDSLIIKIDFDGNIIWSKAYGVGEPGVDFPALTEDFYSVRVTPDNGYIVGGWSSSNSAGGYDFFAMKLDKDGDFLWTKTYGGPDDDYGRSLELTDDGGYIMTGWTESFGAGVSNALIIKLDADGNELWSRTIGSTGRDTGMEVKQSRDGNFMVAGTFSGSGRDVLVAKLDTRGDVLWSKGFGGTAFDIGYSIKQTNDEGYVVAGSKMVRGRMSDFYVIKLDRDGDCCQDCTITPDIGIPSLIVKSSITPQIDVLLDSKSGAKVGASPTEFTEFCIDVESN